MSIELINRLIGRFNDEMITYCHWKSNFYLAEALSGNLDLDLLVDQRSFAKAIRILAELGFKSAVTRFGGAMPSIHHYFGFDASSGQFVHVHLFNRILTGESYVKTHLFPFENMLLENVYNIEQIKVASKPAELLLFVLRTFIKYGSILDLLELLGKSKALTAEVEWLLTDNSIVESVALLKLYCPVIEEALFLKCIAALRRNSSLLERFALAQRMRRCLQVYAKHTWLNLAFSYLQILWEQVVRRISGKKNRTLSTGGMVIAFVGPEATGKSTLVSESSKWLGQVFSVRTIHAGKPPSTWITAPINIFLPLVRQAMPQLRTSRMEGHVTTPDHSLVSPKNGISGLIYALRSVSLAWDRRKLLLAARRSAAQNEFVICDRYPSTTIGAMDSLRLQENPNMTGVIGAIINRLARLENQLYREIPPPDTALKLKVSVETAKRRNQERIKIGKETDEYLESRHRQSGEWNMPGTRYCYIIDTEQSLDETILSVKRSIWESL